MATGPFELYLKAANRKGKMGTVVAADFSTGVATVVTGLSSIKAVVITQAGDPAAGAGDHAYTTMTISGGTISIKAWQDDFVTAATANLLPVHWLAIGN